MPGLSYLMSLSTRPLAPLPNTPHATIGLVSNADSVASSLRAILEFVSTSHLYGTLHSLVDHDFLVSIQRHSVTLICYDLLFLFLGLSPLELSFQVLCTSSAAGHFGSLLATVGVILDGFRSFSSRRDSITQYCTFIQRGNRAWRSQLPSFCIFRVLCYRYFC